MSYIKCTKCGGYVGMIGSTVYLCGCSSTNTDASKISDAQKLASDLREHGFIEPEWESYVAGKLAAALAACAREANERWVKQIAEGPTLTELGEMIASSLAKAKLEEAKWWHLQVALTAMQSEIIDPGTRDECRERIESLERAVGEKG